jgi:glucokinase
MSDGTFMRAFTAKERFADLLAQFPVHVVTGCNPNLLGAAMIARHFAS